MVELACQLPASLKIRRLEKKYILRRIMAQSLPRQIVKGKKRGFNVPIAAWLRRELREVVHETLGSRRIEEMGLFRPEAVAKLIQDHEGKRVDVSRQLWGLLMLMLWHEEQQRRPRHEGCDSMVNRVVLGESSAR
jgi:asparagine synthase (glutamine-hydrolysing)